MWSGPPSRIRPPLSATSRLAVESIRRSQQRISVDANDSKAAELAEIVRQIRELVKVSTPDGGSSGVALPDLTPVLQARDAALGKVASIGTVNPRAGGLVNSAIQSVKRLIARSLNWHVREQVTFN